MQGDLTSPNEKSIREYRAATARPPLRDSRVKIINIVPLLPVPLL